jgi:hypothetical protein
MLKLTPEQLSQVEAWAAEGASLNDVQGRLKEHFGLNITYLDARLLMLDIGVKLKDKPRAEAKPEAAPASAEADEALTDWEDEPSAPAPLPQTPAAGKGGVTISTDQITLPGAIISGKVTFSDGQLVSWQLDQFGRLSMKDAPMGYKPPPGDIPQFQQQLDRVLQRAGF